MNNPCCHFNTMTHGVWAIGVTIGGVSVEYGPVWGVLAVVVGWLFHRYLACHWSVLGILEARA